MLTSRNTRIMIRMDFMVTVLLCVVIIHSGASEPNQYYKTQIGAKPDSRGGDANEKVGFVHPVDLESFAQHVFGGSEVAESRKAPAAAVIHGMTPQSGVYHDQQPFPSLFASEGSEGTTYKVLKFLTPKADSADQAPRSTHSEELYEESYPQSTQKRTFRQSKGKHYGKTSYPSIKGNRRHSDPSPKEYLTDLYSKQKDVEMILPMHKAIILPMVNGKPKPYQGYRAAPGVESYGSSDEGDIIYGKPKKGVDSISYRIKRSPAEYHGGIYPHFDYSDPENADRVSKDNRENTDKESYQKRRRNYPKKHRSKTSDKPYNHYKYPKGNRKTSKRSSEDSEDQSEDADEQAEEDDHRTPSYKYQYDASFNIPELTVKYYPYERFVSGKEKDKKEEGIEDEETHESQIDEYTAGYENYKKTLPTDLESYFGKPDFGDYSVEATENLEQNKNCERITREAQAAENSTETGNGNSDRGKEVCYICTDPKTGGNYEQCAYKSEPKSEKYYYGGTTSFQSDESPQPVNYRYRRSAFGDGFDLDSFIFGRDSELKRRVRQNMEHSLFDGPRREQKRRHKNWHSEADEKDDRYHSYGSYKKQDHHGSPSSRRNKKSKSKEGPPDSYDGPKYTYEGPRHTYEGPAESYEGPINKDYYITSDDRIENDEASQSNDESQTQPKKEYYEYNAYHPPDRRYSQSSRRNRYYPEEKRDVEEIEHEHYGPETSYTADYRFGPEHFVDDEVEEERPKEKQRSEKKPKPVEKRQKHSGSESRQAPSTEKKDKETSNVKVFKNGDVCRKKKVDGMICMVCKNEKTAATYEQCQYSSKPKDKYYAFGSQKSYRTSDPESERGAKNEEEEDQHPEKSDVIEKKILITKQSKIFQDNSGPLDTLPSLGLGFSDLVGSPSDNLETHLYDSNNNDTDNRQVSESIMRIEPRDGIEGLEEYLYSDNEDNEKKATDDDREYRSYDEYFHDIFPEFSNRKENDQYNEESKESDEEGEAEESEESESERHINFDPFSNIRKFKDNSPTFLDEYSVDEEDDTSGNAEASNEEPLRLKNKKSRIPPDFFLEESEEYHKKDIEKALGEFQNRDWSNCKKIVKNKLTCYQCIDKNGVNNEECMYVEASQPLKQHLAYHEKKELKPETLDIRRETKTDEEVVVTEQPTTETPKLSKRMRNPKNAKEAQEEVTDGNNPTRRPIGDFQGVTNAPEEDVMTPVPSLTTESVVQDTSEKPQTRGDKRHQKRIKTSKKAANGTAERVRKRKYPLKKFTEEGGSVTDDTERVVIARPTEETTGTQMKTGVHTPDIK